MKRSIDLNEVSDGRLYHRNDLVKADCNGCKDCHACCHGMGKSIVLDPFDIFQLTTNLSISFEQLLVDKIELNIVEGIILPNLKMREDTEDCVFLNEDGRCSIHKYRPGICRIFPLGRIYENQRFQYFLQVKECKYENKSKVKVYRWIDVERPKENETFINTWHYFLLELQVIVTSNTEETTIKKLTMYILQQFFIKPYRKDMDFYQQFQKRLEEARTLLCLEKGA